jgi:hypothetical protein
MENEDGSDKWIEGTDKIMISSVEVKQRIWKKYKDMQQL